MPYTLTNDRDFKFKANLDWLIKFKLSSLTRCRWGCVGALGHARRAASQVANELSISYHYLAVQSGSVARGLCALWPSDDKATGHSPEYRCQEVIEMRRGVNDNSIVCQTTATAAQRSVFELARQLQFQSMSALASFAFVPQNRCLLPRLLPLLEDALRLGCRILRRHYRAVLHHRMTTSTANSHCTTG